MNVKFYDLRNKEIICVTNGLKIGFVDDIEFDTDEFKITRLIAYGGGRFFGLFGRYDDIQIKLEDIDVIGEDIILVKNYSNLNSPRRNTTWIGKMFQQNP